MELYGPWSFWPNEITKLPSWCFRNATEFCDKSIGVTKSPLLVTLSMVLATSGFISAVRKNHLVAKLALLITFAWLPVMVLNAMHVYPMVGRFLLFLAPPAIIFIFRGLGIFPFRFRAISALLAAIILWAPFCAGLPAHYTARVHEDARSSLKYVHAHFQPGDYVYIFGGGRYSFRYYCQLEDWTPPDLLVGEPHRDAGGYDAELMRLIGKPRVWMMMVHTHMGEQGTPGGKWAYSKLRTMATRLDSVRYPDAEVLFCDFTGKKGSAIDETFPQSIPDDSVHGEAP
jgi:hypothetical protein